MTKDLPWGNFGHFFSDAYRTAANIGLDAVWFGEKEEEAKGKTMDHLAIPLRIMRFFGTDLEAVRCEYTIEGQPRDRPVLHPLGLVSTIAQGALTVPYADPEEKGQGQGESDYTVAKRWVEWFWHQPLRKGDRRYYDNCLYLFALLALSGRYRIW